MISRRRRIHKPLKRPPFPHPQNPQNPQVISSHHISWRETCHVWYSQLRTFRGNARLSNGLQPISLGLGNTRLVSDVNGLGPTGSAGDLRIVSWEDSSKTMLVNLIVLNEIACHFVGPPDPGTPSRAGDPRHEIDELHNALRI